MNKLTVETYDRAAAAYAKKFAGIGPRVRDIKEAIAAWGSTAPRVLELGCGDGRDAKEIIKLSSDYLGIDNSKGMISIARKQVPQAKFVVADMATYDFSVPVDIIFAFASLLHIDKETLALVLQRARTALSAGGIFYLSVKRGEYHGGEVVSDEYGERIFYYYQKSDIMDLAQGYEEVKTIERIFSDTTWLDVILRKR